MIRQQRSRGSGHRLFGLACFSIAGLSLLSGCSSFDSRWKAAGTAFPAAPHSLQGRWEGTWLSQDEGHTGKLRCIVTHKEGDIYQAEFDATYWKIFQFEYGLDIHAGQDAPGQYRIEGDSDLGWLAGGKYHCEGAASVTGNPATDSFNCTYKSSKNNGNFQMTRPTVSPK